MKYSHVKLIAKSFKNLILFFALTFPVLNNSACMHAFSKLLITIVMVASYILYVILYLSCNLVMIAGSVG